MRRSSILISVVASVIFPTVGYLALAGAKSMDHSSHSSNEAGPHYEAALPSEPGQSAFAAIAEIVELLNSNPHTDWSSVNITRLREHLVDMELLSTEAIVMQSSSDDTITFVVRGTGRTLSAIQSMVPAHAEELSKSFPWRVETQPLDDGIEMKIKTSSGSEQLKLSALGFFGVMATGAHHQEHHLAMAKGERHGH